MKRDDYRRKQHDHEGDEASMFDRFEPTMGRHHCICPSIPFGWPRPIFGPAGNIEK
jgi:hypothetical protein